MKKTSLMAACSLVPLAAAALFVPSVYAQDKPAEPQEAEVVIVTGTRQGLQKAIQVKRVSTQFVDSVIAEDIGKLPDVNVAESLQRISGVQIKRSLGEGTQVSIRGLNQNITLVNGHDVVDAAGRGGSGLDTLGTGSYGLLAQLPSEIIQRLDVTKLAAASDIEGALSGTVNIVTAKPLDSKSELRAFSVEGLYNDRSEKSGGRASVLLSKRFSDQLGALVNISYSDRNIRDESIFSFAGYQPLSAAFDTGATANTLGAGGTTLSRNPNGQGTPGFYLTDIRNTQIDDSRQRLGFNGSLQWRPSANAEYYADVLYSKQDIQRDRYWTAVNLSTVGTDYTSIVFSPTETVLAGTLNTSYQGNTELYTNEGTTLSGSIGGRWNFSNVTATGDVSVSNSKQDQYQTFLRLTTKAKYLTSFDFRNVDVPKFEVSSALDTTNPALFNFTNYFDNRDVAESSQSAARFDVVWALDSGFLSDVKAGVRVSELKVDIDKYVNQASGPVSADTVPDSFRIGRLNILDGASGYTPRSTLLPVLFGGGKKLACEVKGTTCVPRNYAPLASYKTEEKVTAVYFQGNIDTQVSNIPVKGNFGVRYVETDFNAQGSRTSPTSAVAILPVNVDKKYEDVLPSLSLKAELTDKLLVRFGAAKVIARPNSSDQNPGLALQNVAPFIATAGNAELDPFRASQMDLSLEYYFQPASLVSIGVFSKDLKSFIVRSATSEVYDGITYIVTRPRNGADAKVKGVELVYQDNFEFLPSPFDGLGVVANVSLIDSETRDINQRTGEALPLTGLSKTNLNVVLFWEKGDYGVRLAYNWRDKYLDSIGSGGDGVFFDTSEDLSLSARWQITPIFSVDAQVSNLLDSRVRKYGGVEDATALYALNGRTLSLAFRGKF
jgi:TonB-dependent receptor